MNPLYIAILVSLFVLAVIGWVWFLNDDWDLPFACAMGPSVLFVILLGISFGGDWGIPTVSTTKDIRVEQTPYRVIVSAFGEELIWKDAYSVARAKEIVGIQRTIKRNAWGIQLAIKPYQPTYDLVFNP